MCCPSYFLFITKKSSYVIEADDPVKAMDIFKKNNVQNSHNVVLDIKYIR